MSLGAILLMALLAVIGTLLLLAAVEKFARETLGFEDFPSITGDMWEFLKRIPDALTNAVKNIINALADFIKAPFEAFYNTLMSYGLEPAFAQGIATLIIVLTVIGIILAIIKLRGWL